MFVNFSLTRIREFSAYQQAEVIILPIEESVVAQMNIVANQLLLREFFAQFSSIPSPLFRLVFQSVLSLLLPVCTWIRLFLASRHSYRPSSYCPHAHFFSCALFHFYRDFFRATRILF